MTSKIVVYIWLITIFLLTIGLFIYVTNRLLNETNTNIKIQIQEII